jgi:hypothetical protein
MDGPDDRIPGARAELRAISGIEKENVYNEPLAKSS